jgi:hypothetical protein
MKATDFNLRAGIKFDVDKGLTTFQDSRLVIFDSNAIGLLRNELIQVLGLKKAKIIFLRFGFQHGYADFMQMSENYKFDSEMDLLASGPIIHTWEGIVHAKPKDLSVDRKKGEMFFTGIWTNSYEAEQHLSYHKPGKEPVCWSLMGYASGYATAFLRKPVIGIEPVCRGKGDKHCEWKLMNIEAWGKEADLYKEAYSEFFEKVAIKWPKSQ